MPRNVYRAAVHFLHNGRQILPLLLIQQLLQHLKTLLIAGRIHAGNDVELFHFAQVKVECGFVFFARRGVLKQDLENLFVAVFGIITQHIILEILHHLKPVVLEQEKGFR